MGLRSLTAVIVGGEWSVLQPGRFTPEERARGSHWIGDWVGPRTGLEDVERKKYCLYLDPKSEPLAIQPLASRYTYCAIPSHKSTYRLIKQIVTDTYIYDTGPTGRTEFHAY
jgi:hypothetical protein